MKKKCKSAELDLVKKYQNWTFKVNTLCQKLSKSFYFFFNEE